MLHKLDFIEEKYEELSKKIADPELLQIILFFKSLCKEHSSMEPIVSKYREYKDIQKRLKEDKEMLQEGGLDDEMEQLVKEEIKELEEKVVETEKELKILTSSKGSK
ncbi:MAG: hypothetical protein KatS3mg079_625 [Caloramator sp.]|nr:MAG: hypothetical protein KatS3mg079_625 [Caloramator sp.]